MAISEALSQVANNVPKVIKTANWKMEEEICLSKRKRWFKNICTHLSLELSDHCEIEGGNIGRAMSVDDYTNTVSQAHWTVSYTCEFIEAMTTCTRQA